MRVRSKLATLLLAMAVGAAAQSNPSRIHAGEHRSGTKFEAVSSRDNFSAQQSSNTPGSSSSKQRETTTPASPSTSKPGTTKHNTQTGTAAAKPGAAGTSSSRASLTANWTRYCAPEGDFCVKYPTTWQPLGDSADSGGLIIAPAQPQKPAAQWSNVTVTATDLPQPPEGKERPTFDELIGVVLESMRPGVNQQTLERRQMDVDGLPAQSLKLRYTEEGRTWIEEIVLIDGEDVVYSLALRCTPEELPSFEPIFREIVGTWKAVEQ
jgi:hypothetical protein